MKRLLFTFAFLGIIALANGQDPDVLKSDAIMAESIDDFASAAQLYESAMAAYEAADRFDTASVYRAGVNYHRIKEYQKALTFFEKLEAQDMGSADLFLSMSDSYAGLNQFDKSSDALLKVVASYPEEKNTAYRKLVTVSFNGRDFANAVKYADETLEVAPGDTHVLFIKMMAFAQQSKINEALATGEQLLAIDPDHQRATEQMGLILSKVTDAEYDREKRRYEAMSNPTRVDYSNTTKKLAAISTKYNKAIPYLEKALAINPNNTAVKNALENAQRRLRE